MKLFRLANNKSGVFRSTVAPPPPPEAIPSHHVPVMADEIVEAMEPRDGQRFIDATFGGGGHTRRLLATGSRITVFALDRDPEAFQRATILSRQIPAESGQRVVPLLGRFSQLRGLLERLAVPRNSIDGAIMDLGASSQQYQTERRGFSLRLDGPLDMRMDGDRFEHQQPTAADVVNSLGAHELARIFKTYGEEKHAMKIAQAIVDSRFMMKRLNTTGELAELIGQILDGDHRSDKLGRVVHPATKVFQALRIFVNNELNELNYAIQTLRPYLKVKQNTTNADQDEEELVTQTRNDGGLLAILSFHSLEDKIVKGHFQSQEDYIAAITERNRPDDRLISGPPSLPDKPKRFWRFYRKRLMIPTEEEVHHNPKARSAKLRIGLRIA